MQLKDFNIEDKTFTKCTEERYFLFLRDIEHELVKISGENVENVEYSKEILSDFIRSTFNYTCSDYRYRLTKYSKRNDEGNIDIFVVISCVDMLNGDYPIKKVAFYHVIITPQ